MSTSALILPASRRGRCLDSPAMIKRLIAAAVLLGALFATTAPASATCVPGKIGFENGKPVVRLPQCDGPPQ